MQKKKEGKKCIVEYYCNPQYIVYKRTVISHTIQNIVTLYIYIYIEPELVDTEENVVDFTF